VIRAWLAVVRFEAVTLLRMRETYTFGLVPGLVGFPLLVVGMVGVILLKPTPTVAVPFDAPLPLSKRVTERAVSDPEGAFARGEVDLAVLSATEAPDGSWTVQARWRDDAGRERLASALDEGVLAAFDRRVVAAGGAVAGSRKVARLDRASAASPRPAEDLGRPFALLYTFAAVYLSCYLVPVRVASERAAGVLEALAVCPTPLWVVGSARLVVVAALGLTVPALAASSLVLIAGPIAPAPTAGTVAEVVATTLLVDALFLAIGAAAGSARTALGWASSALLVCLGGATVALTAPLPWLPILGFGAGDAPHLAARLAGLVAGLVVVGGGTAWWLRADAVLPPAGGAA
jgi:hypothetical protein